MSIEDIQTTINEIENSAKLAFMQDMMVLKFIWLWLSVHQFCSPISNLRSDSYGLKRIINFDANMIHN